MPVVQIILLGALVSTAALGQTVSNVASAGYRFPDPLPVAPGQIITLFVRAPACPLDPLKVAVQANGTTSQDFSFTITGQQAHVVSSCEFQFLLNCMPPAAKVFHADGTPLGPTAPAQAGEVVVVYAVGLGPVNGAKTGEAATSSVPALSPLVTWGVFSFPSALLQPVRVLQPAQLAVSVNLVQGFVGLYQLAIILSGSLPQGTLDCTTSQLKNANVRLFIGNGDAPENVDLCMRQ